MTYGNETSVTFLEFKVKIGMQYMPLVKFSIVDQLRSFLLRKLISIDRSVTLH